MTSECVGQPMFGSAEICRRARTRPKRGSYRVRKALEQWTGRRAHQPLEDNQASDVRPSQLGTPPSPNDPGRVIAPTSPSLPKSYFRTVVHSWRLLGFLTIFSELTGVDRDAETRIGLFPDIRFGPVILDISGGDVREERQVLGHAIEYRPSILVLLIADAVTIVAGGRDG